MTRPLIRRYDGTTDTTDTTGSKSSGFSLLTGCLELSLKPRNSLIYLAVSVGTVSTVVTAISNCEGSF
jgi:fibrillarin-like rRNA methylase